MHYSYDKPEKLIVWLVIKFKRIIRSLKAGETVTYIKKTILICGMSVLLLSDDESKRQAWQVEF